LAWVDAPKEAPAEYPQQRNPAAQETRQQRDAHHQIGLQAVARGVAVAKHVDQAPECRASVRHRQVESKGEVLRRLADLASPQAEPRAQVPPLQELRSPPPEQEPGLWAQPSRA
jgi:hypothetical protein